MKLLVKAGGAEAQFDMDGAYELLVELGDTPRVTVTTVDGSVTTVVPTPTQEPVPVAVPLPVPECLPDPVPEPEPVVVEPLAADDAVELLDYSVGV